MSMRGHSGVSAELAAVDGRRRINMDKVMTGICFVLLLIIVVIYQEVRFLLLTPHITCI